MPGMSIFNNFQTLAYTISYASGALLRGRRNDFAGFAAYVQESVLYYYSDAKFAIDVSFLKEDLQKASFFSFQYLSISQ